MRFALAQVNSGEGTLEENFTRALERVRTAHAQGATLTVFPENALDDLTGTRQYQPCYAHEFCTRMARFVELAPGSVLACIVPFPDLAPLFAPGEFERLAGQSQDDFDDTEPLLDYLPLTYVLIENGQIFALTPREEGLLSTFEHEGVTIAFNNFAYSSENLPRLGAALYLQAQGACYASDLDIPAAATLIDELETLIDDADEPVALPPAALVSQVGLLNERVFAGESCIVDTNRRVVAAAPAFEEALVLCDLDPATGQLAPLDHAQVTAAGALCARLAAIERGDQPGHVAHEDGFEARFNAGVDFDRLFSALSMSIRDYVEKNGLPGVLVGLSGGMDSSLVATLAVHALGPRRVIGVLMPGPYTSDEAKEDATELAYNLNIETRTHEISGMTNAFIRVFGQEHKAVIEQNVQARMRGLTLMTLSNALGHIVLNTSNKSEAAMGYSTLYGDTVGAFAPLADVYKTHVYPLARAAASRFGTNPIPERVFVKPPSAELAPDQTDEGSLGASYLQIDAALGAYLSTFDSPQSIATTLQEKGLEVSDKTVASVINRLHANTFKRRQEPYGPCVSTVALDGECWSLTCRWKLQA